MNSSHRSSLTLCFTFHRILHIPATVGSLIFSSCSLVSVLWVPPTELTSTQSYNLIDTGIYLSFHFSLCKDSTEFVCQTRKVHSDEDRHWYRGTLSKSETHIDFFTNSCQCAVKAMSAALPSTLLDCGKHKRQHCSEQEQQRRCSCILTKYTDNFQWLYLYN